MIKLVFSTVFSILVFFAFGQTITWKKLADIPEGYMSGEAVSMGNKIYFATGRTEKSTSNTFYEFDIALNKWTELANIPEPSTNLSMAVVNEKIYLIGGDKFLDVNQQYDPKTDSWKMLENMPTARQHIDCGIYDNKIYVVGGLASWKDISKKNEVFDVETGLWSEKADIPSLRNNPAVVNIDSMIYVIGGGGNKNDIWAFINKVECYNTESNTWESKNKLPYVLFKPASTVVGNEIFVLGGLTKTDGKDECSDKVLIYKPEDDTWAETTPLPVKNVFFGCTSVGNSIYVIGGTPGGHPDWRAYKSVYEGVYNPEGAIK